MAETIDEITVDYSDEGKLVRRQIDKKVLTKGAWSTLMFKYQDMDRQKDAWGPDKYMIARYQKVSGRYMQKSKFNISSKAQAEKIIESLQEWIKDAKDGDGEDGGE